MMMLMGWWMTTIVALSAVAYAGPAGAPSTALGDYAVLGLKEVTLRGRASVLSGDVGCNAPNGTVTLFDRARVSGSIAADHVRLGRRASAGGLYCTLLEQLAAKNPPAECVPATPPLIDAAALPIVQVTPGTQRVQLERRAALDPLPPGAYDLFRVANGARLVLAGGDYAVRTIDLRKRAQLLCQTACRLSVLERVRVGEGSELGPVPPLDATAVRVDVKGEGQPPAFRAFRRSTVSATVYAPGGNVQLGMNGRYTGAFVGERVLIWPLARIEAASAL
jgi:hypothetical protein